MVNAAANTVTTLSEARTDRDGYAWVTYDPGSRSHGIFLGDAVVHARKHDARADVLAMEGSSIVEGSISWSGEGGGRKPTELQIMLVQMSGRYIRQVYVCRAEIGQQFRFEGVAMGEYELRASAVRDSMHGGGIGPMSFGPRTIDSRRVRIDIQVPAK